MTPQEIRDECTAIAELVGKRADVSASIRATSGEDLVGVFIWPAGVCGPMSATNVRVYAETFEGAFAAARAEWAKVRADHEHETVRKMALRIIRVTDEQGECTDAALRQHFDQSEIDRLGSEALTLADKMAGNGPFTIVATRGQNAA